MEDLGKKPRSKTQDKFCDYMISTVRIGVYSTCVSDLYPGLPGVGAERSYFECCV